jgi:hypothetical protein
MAGAPITSMLRGTGTPTRGGHSIAPLSSPVGKCSAVPFGSGIQFASSPAARSGYVTRVRFRVRLGTVDKWKAWAAPHTAGREYPSRQRSPDPNEKGSRTRLLPHRQTLDWLENSARDSYRPGPRRKEALVAAASCTERCSDGGRKRESRRHTETLIDYRKNNKPMKDGENRLILSRIAPVRFRAKEWSRFRKLQM